MEATQHAHDFDHEEGESLWYTYFGETGAATVAFLYVTVIAFIIFCFLRWG